MNLCFVGIRVLGEFSALFLRSLSIAARPDRFGLRVSGIHAFRVIPLILVCIAMTLISIPVNLATRALRRLLLGLTLVVAIGACGQESTARPLEAQRMCGWTDSTRLTPQGIGDLRIGTSAAELARRCLVVRDTIESQEGMPQRFVYVRVGDAEAYAEIVLDSVWRIGTRDSLLRTADGLGVGTTVRTLLANEPEWAGHGERGVAVGLRGHCRLSFLLAPMFTAPNRPLFVRRVADLQRAPDTRVVEVFVVGAAHCDSRAPR